MAHTPSDTRLRRAPIGKADPPVGSQVGGSTILPPLSVERGLPHGSSNPGATDSHLQLEEDQASPPKPNKPSGEREAFTVTK